MTSRTLCNLLALCALALLLAACGGGNGANAVDADIDPVEADPSILATYPEHEDRDVDEATDIYIDFAVDVDPAANHADYLRVETAAGRIDGTWTYDPAQRRLTFVPASDLPIGAMHRVQLTPGLPFADGGQQADDFAFDFETRAPAFEGPQYLELLADTASVNRVAMHPNGNGVALFGVLRADGRTEYSARFKPAGGDFEIRDALYIDDKAEFRAEGLAVNARGDAVWAWKRLVGAGHLGYYMTYDRQSNTWSSVRLFQSWLNRTMAYAKVGIDDAGNAFFAWPETNIATGDSYMAARRVTAGGTLENYEYFDDETDVPGTNYLDVNARGDAVIAWQQRDSTGFTSCHAATYTNGAWSGQEILETIQGRHSWMLGARMAPDGHAAVLMADSRTGNYTEVPMVAAYLPQGQPNPGWQPPVPVEAHVGEANEYRLFVTADGTFIAVYSQVEDANDTGAVRGLRYAPSAGVFQPMALSAPQIERIDSAYLYASVAPSGEALVIWTEQTVTVDDTLKAAVLRNNGDVVPDITVRTLTAGETVRGDPAVAVSPHGGGMVVWNEPDPMLGGLPARRLASVRVDAAGRVGPVAFQHATPGDKAGTMRLHIDEKGLGALVWKQIDSSTDHADIRYRIIR